MSGNHYPTPPPRSPWSSPIVIGAIVAGVFILALAVVLGFLLIPSDNSSSDAETSSTTTTPPVSTQTVTAQPSTVTSTVTPTTTTTTAPTTATTPVGPLPNVPGTDRRGFVSGPRCNATEDAAVMVGQTSRSKIVVCQVGNQTGRYYYKGLANGMSLEIGFPTRSGNQFVAVNRDSAYLMDPSSLTITTNGEVVSVEPMIYYWTN